MSEGNRLYYGDNLNILRDSIESESVDLVYLDPPFNSSRDYNVIFKDESGNKSDAQLLAFEDTWRWGPSAEETYAYLTNTSRHKGSVPDSVSTLIAALRSGIGTNQMLAYIVEMTVRLGELHRVLKATGSLYLHCDPTASHYLKVVLDAVFGPTNFRSEIVWKRTGAHSDTKQGRKIHGHIHDTLLYYTKSNDWKWNPIYLPLDRDYVEQFYRHVDSATGRMYRVDNLTAAKPGGDTSYEWHGVKPYKGRFWAYSKTNMEKFEAEGRLIYSKSGMPQYKRYLDESPGVPLQDIWTDMSAIGSGSAERLGYPTQKPLALLERIIASSTDAGDTVLDPFCGCGTAVVAAQKLERKWIGIDVTYLAIAVMKARLKDTFGLDDIPVLGQPTEVEGARAFANSPEGRYQFQWWALNLIDATPVGGVQKKGADRGIDGVITFTNEAGKMEGVLVSVKSGKVNSAQVRDLKGTVERDKAAIGLFITLDEPTKEMKLEATTAGAYHSDLWNREYPKLQILTIAELLSGRKPELPSFKSAPYQKAPKIRTKADQTGLFDQPLAMVDEGEPDEPYAAESTE